MELASFTHGRFGRCGQLRESICVLKDAWYNLLLHYAVDRNRSGRHMGTHSLGPKWKCIVLLFGFVSLRDARLSIRDDDSLCESHEYRELPVADDEHCWCQHCIDVRIQREHDNSSVLGSRICHRKQSVFHPVKRQLLPGAGFRVSVWGTSM